MGFRFQRISQNPYTTICRDLSELGLCGLSEGLLRNYTSHKFVKISLYALELGLYDALNTFGS